MLTVISEDSIQSSVALGYKYLTYSSECWSVRGRHPCLWILENLEVIKRTNNGETHQYHLEVLQYINSEKENHNSQTPLCQKIEWHQLWQEERLGSHQDRMWDVNVTGVRVPLEHEKLWETGCVTPQTNMPVRHFHWNRNVPVVSAASTAKAHQHYWEIHKTKTWRVPTALQEVLGQGLDPNSEAAKPHPHVQTSSSTNSFFANFTLVVPLALEPNAHKVCERNIQSRITNAVTWRLSSEEPYPSCQRECLIT